MKITYRLATLSEGILNALAGVASTSERLLTDMANRCASTEGRETIALALAELRAGVANPQLIETHWVKEYTGQLEFCGFNHNTAQRAEVRDGMLTITGERHALLSGRLGAVVELLVSESPEFVDYDTSDTRLKPFETLQAYLYQRGSKAEKIEYFRKFYTPQGEWTGSSNEGAALASWGLSREEILTVAAFPLVDLGDEEPGYIPRDRRGVKFGKPSHLR